jgi:hypothetical protein
VPVWWNSTLLMIRRLLEQRKAIDEFAIQKRNFDFTLFEKGWANALELERILSAVENVSKLFCSSRISSVIPYATSLQKLFSTIKVKNTLFANMCNEMTKELNTRFIAKFDQKYLI